MLSHGIFKAVLSSALDPPFMFPTDAPGGAGPRPSGSAGTQTRPLPGEGSSCSREEGELQIRGGTDTHTRPNLPDTRSRRDQTMRKDEPPMKKRLLTLTAVICLLLSLAACGGGQTPAEDQPEEAAPMTAEEYQAEVDAASTALGEAMVALNSLSATDEESFRAGIETVRSMAAPLRDLAAIDNPPEDYAQAHAQVSAGCTLFADTLDGLCDGAIAMLDGEMTAEDYNTAMTDYVTSLAEAATQITDGLTLMEG